MLADSAKRQNAFADRICSGVRHSGSNSFGDPTIIAKQRGYIVDYIGLANHLKDALSIYGDDDKEDIEDALVDITVEQPVLDDRYRRLLTLFQDGGVKEMGFRMWK